MSLRVCVLASGSSGNCTYVASETTRILVDAGISGREIAARLNAIGVDAAGIDAVCLTHEHDDHRAALGVLQRRHGTALYANAGTVDGLNADRRLEGVAWNIFTTGSPFVIGDLKVEPFSVPHDSYDPVGFAISAGAARVGIVTDLGTATGLVRERLKSCGLLILESNHDEDLLRDSERPWPLKQRIAGRQGHFSNKQAAELIAELAGAHLHSVLLAHLSAECNQPGLALETVRRALTASGHADVAVQLTYADRPTGIVVLDS